MRQLETSEFIHMHGWHWLLNCVQKNGRLPSFQVMLTEVQCADSLRNIHIIRAVIWGIMHLLVLLVRFPATTFPIEVRVRASQLPAPLFDMPYGGFATLTVLTVLTITLHTMHR
jgi:hypothetical protein